MTSVTVYYEKQNKFSYKFPVFDTSMPVLGVITGPDGMQVGRYDLRVPLPGGPYFRSMTAYEAVDQAKCGEYGLVWIPEPETEDVT